LFIYFKPYRNNSITGIFSHSLIIIISQQQEEKRETKTCKLLKKVIFIILKAQQTLNCNIFFSVYSFSKFFFYFFSIEFSIFFVYYYVYIFINLIVKFQMKIIDDTSIKIFPYYLFFYHLFFLFFSLLTHTNTYSLRVFPLKMSICARPDWFFSI